MKGDREGFREGLRIIWAIAAKDIVDAVKNRTTATLLFAVALVMLQGQTLPILLGLTQRLSLVVYDQGRSQLAAGLRASSEVRLTRADSQARLESILTATGMGGLGLVLPADFDQRLASGGPLQIDGFFAWADRTRAPALQSEAEALLAQLAGKPVRIDVEGHVVYPGPDAVGYQTVNSLVLIIVILLVGAFLVPELMFEEKERRTLEVLLVSPAGTGQIVAGKAVAGAFYCLTASAVALAFHGQWIVHWPLAILATLVGALLAVAVGLLLGSVFENAQQMGLLAGVPLTFLVLPVLVGDLPAVPAALRMNLLPWLPTVALARAFRLSFAGSVPLGQAALSLGIVAAWAVLVLAGVVAVVRRADR